MALRITTTGTTVELYDLGITVAHPTTNRDLALEFSDLELKRSEDLTQAIQAGDLLVDDGTHSIASDDYDPDELLLQNLGIRGDSRYISNDELKSVGDILIRSSTFPLGVNSTAAITRNIYVPSARWITWELEIGDKVVLSGNAAAGTYTVESITDQQNFIVVEAVVNSTGGNIDVYHQPGTLRISVSGLQNISGDNLQEVLEDIDLQVGGGGISAGQHQVLDQLVHSIAEDSYDEVSYTGTQVDSYIVWTDSGKTIKIREELFTYTGTKVDTVTVIQYDAVGVEVERYVETYTYSGNNVTSIDRVYT